uniref:J domain-containing protein n=1 Tax=Caenorhabditis japonica TaxID=281687 RepID=A0A8R1E0Y3_CAEJA
MRKLGLERFETSISDYEKAISLDESNEVARSGVEQAKRAKELVGKRDYYKILGVKRSATKREITKAYRKAAQKWHPDNFSNPGEKKRAEKKFIDIASAKEVLTDEEKRKAFDNGQDPLDPEYAQNHGGGGGGGGHPFYEGSFGGGGGGFHSFKSGGGSYFFSF